MDLLEEEIKMIKESYYFSHDANAAHDPKIVQLRSVYGYEGYGWYWRLVEIMRDQANYKLNIGGKYGVQGIANECSTSAERMLNFIEDCVDEFKLFIREGDSIWSESLVKRMNKRDEIIRQKQEAGKKSAEKRQQKQGIITDVQQVLQQNPTVVEQGKERKGKEIEIKYKEHTLVVFEKEKQEEEFEKIWEKYPNRDGKKAALRHFIATVKTDRDVERINIALNKYLEHLERENKWNFIKAGSTWFNNWQDWENYQPSPKSVQLKGNAVVDAARSVLSKRIQEGRYEEVV